MDIDVTKISSFKELKKVYSDLEEAENSIKDEINELFNKKIIIVDEMSKLEVSIPNMENMEKNSNSLCDMMIFAAELADNVSIKVRQLDLAKNRVHQCICRVEDILDLKACTEGVQKALGDKNYEAAAGFIRRFLDMDENMLRLTEQEAENSLNILHNCAKEMKEISITNFDLAIKSDDFKMINKFLKILPMIGEKKLGLEKFGYYLNSKINEQMRGQVKLSDVTDTERHMVKYVDLMTSLIECVGEIIKKYAPLVQEYYGAGYLYILLGVIHKECDTWSLTIVDKFKRERHINSFIQLIERLMKCPSTTWSVDRDAGGSYGDGGSLSTSSGAVGTANSSAYLHKHQVELVDLEIIINEIAMMNCRVELYLRYLKRKIQTDLEAANTKTPTEITEDCYRFFSNLKIIGEMQGLINNYILFEEYFLREMIFKAVKIPEIDDKTNSLLLVHSVFFAVNKCIKRTLSSGNIEGLCAILNLSSMIVIESYINNTLQDKLFNQYNISNMSTAWMRDAYSYVHSGVLTAGVTSSAQLSSVASSTGLSTLGANNPSTMSSGTGGANTGSSSNLMSAATGATSIGNQNRQTMFIVCINTIETSIDCNETLRSELSHELHNHFSKSDPAALSKISECLASMSSSIADKLRELTDKAMNQLTCYLIRPQIKTFCNNLKHMKHIISEEEFLSYEANDPWVEQYIVLVQDLINEFNEIMQPAIYEKVIQKICEETVSRIEKIIKTKSFNKLGGIQFDREIRNLINFFSCTNQWGIREKFTRLRQIANILNLESVSEISNYWEQMTWRLNPAEVRQFMALRSEFRTEDIRMLVLR